MWAHTCECTFMCRPEANVWAIHQSLTTTSFATGSLTEPDAHQLARLAGQSSRGPPVSAHSALALQT